MCIKNKIITTLSIMLCTLAAFAGQQKGYDIKITVKQLANSKLILAYYYADKQYIKDTFNIDSKGVCEIKADTNLPAGIYLAAFPVLGNQYFEFVVNEQKFSLSTDTNDLGGHLVISGSLENELFYREIKFQTKIYKENEELNKEYRDTTLSEKKKKAIIEKVKKLEIQIEKEQDSVIKTFPNTFYATILNSMKAIKPKDLNDGPKNPKGQLIDSSWAWRDYKERYWDNIDFRDDRLINTPVFFGKLKEFYTRTIIQIPDSIIEESDKLLSKMPPKGELFKFSLTFMLNEMAKSQNIGFDAVYAHLVRNYYAKGMAPWVDSVQLFRIKDRGRALAPLLIGRKAMYLQLADTTLTTYHSLYDLTNRFVILCFWDPDCGHCKKEIPKLIDVYHKMKKDGIDVEVYAAATFATPDDIKKWTAFIREYDLDWINVADPYRRNNFRYEWDLQSTPQIYILDKEKVIRMKRIGAEQIEDFIKHEIDPKYRPKKAPVAETENAPEPGDNKK